MGDVRGKVATLHNLAYIYAQQGQVEEVIALYQQSLELVKINQ
ncbi:MAG: tetratricopeptide repeat protein [Xenococcaceae cyanobacterium]